MGPQQIRCGKMDTRDKFFQMIAASMGPQQIRCGKNRWLADDHWFATRFNGAAANSLRKRLQSEGHYTALTRFNGAAANSLRKTPTRIYRAIMFGGLQWGRSKFAAENSVADILASRSRCFNGAAANSLRKRHRIRFMTLTMRLQWGRSKFAAENVASQITRFTTLTATFTSDR